MTAFRTVICVVAQFRNRYSDERRKIGFAAKCMLDRTVELLWLRRLQNERGCPEVKRRRSNLLFIRRADENDFSSPGGPPDVRRDPSVGAGHHDVEHNHVWFEFDCGLEYWPLSDTPPTMSCDNCNQRRQALTSPG